MKNRIPSGRTSAVLQFRPSQSPTPRTGSDDRCIGIIVGEPTTRKIRFAVDRDHIPERLDYVIVPDFLVHRRGSTRKVRALAEVTEVSGQSVYFDADSSVAAAREFARRGLDDARTFCCARMLGYVDPLTGDRLVPRSLPLPGHPVHTATDRDLRGFFGSTAEGRIEIGTLFGRADVPIGLDVTGLGRHLAILGQTRVGKSNLVGRLVEELHGLGGTVLILDPNSDYVRMRFTSDGSERTWADRIHIFRPTGGHPRHGENRTGPVEPLVYVFSALSFDQQCSLAEIYPAMSRLRAAFKVAINRARLTNPRYQPSDVYAALTEMLGELRDRPTGRRKRAESTEQSVAADLDKVSGVDVESVMRRLEDRLMRDGSLWADDGIDLDRFFAPQTVSVLDLDGTNRRTIDTLLSILLRSVWSKAQRGLRYPLVIVVEEAHNIAPRLPSTNGGDGEYGSTYWIRRIAAEGAKLGLYLIVVSQRPSKLDEDVLANCNSQIVLRLTNPRDQHAVSESSEQMSQDLLDDLPALNVGEAIAIGPIVPSPAHLEIRQRSSAQGGASRHIIQDLAKARAAVKRAQTRNGGVSSAIR